ncbi:phospholipase [soil metagenome]
MLALIIMTLCTFAAHAAGYRLASWKDDLFAYPRVIESKDNGAYVVVDYKELRDINERDEIPERRALPQYVELAFEKKMTWQVGGATLNAIGFGAIEGGARAVVIYIHGIGGDRYQGANQWMFGGNFNRAMNLMVRNAGAYLSPDFSDFGAKGTGEIKALMKSQAKASPGAAIFVACGSQGGAICWQLAADAEAANLLAGLLLLGSNHDDAFVNGPAFRKRVPLYLGHGSKDVVFGWEGEAAFYRKVRAAAPTYPIRFALFETGTHGTPIRMTDWRLVLNWMLEAQGK